MKRKVICTEHVEEKATNPTSLFAVASERSIHVSLRRSKRHNALHTPANLTGLPNIYRSTQTSKVLQCRQQHVVQPPSSCPKKWFKSVLDVQDSLSICHEPLKIPKGSVALYSLMKQAESERIANAIKLDENKKELENERAIKAEAIKAKARKVVSKVREKSQDTIFSNRRNGVSIYWYSSEARNLFKPDTPSRTCIIDVLYDRIELFHQALKNELIWRQLIEGSLIAYDLSSFEHKKMDVKIRCVKMVTDEAIEIMGTGKVGHNFQMWCCQNVCTWASLLEGGNWPRYW